MKKMNRVIAAILSAVMLAGNVPEIGYLSVGAESDPTMQQTAESTVEPAAEGEAEKNDTKGNSAEDGAINASGTDEHADSQKTVTDTAGQNAVQYDLADAGTAEEKGTDEQVPAEKNEDIILIVDDDQQERTADDAEILYYDQVTFKLKDETDKTDIKFFYSNEKDSDDYTDITDASNPAYADDYLNLAPGTWYLKYQYEEGTDTISSQEPVEIKVVRAPLKTPNVKIENGNLTWDAVAETTTGYSVTDVQYTYKVTKKDSEKSEEKTISDTYRNNLIQNMAEDDGWKSGIYTINVTASAGNDTNVTASIPGTLEYIAPTITVSYGPEFSDAATSFPLYPGAASQYSARPISAAANEGYVFDHWELPAGITAADAKKSSTIVTINDDYSGHENIEIKAVSDDTGKPEITNFRKDSYNTLAAEISDKETSVAAYAFDQNPESNEDTQWIDAASATTVYYTLSADSTGTYYLHVKDTGGNIKDSDRLQVTEVKLHSVIRNEDGSYAYGANADASTSVTSVFLVGNESLTLPEPSRVGYSFGGWHLDSAEGQEAVQPLTSHQDHAYDLYPSWNLQKMNLAIDESLKAADGRYLLEKTYDGAASDIKVSISGTTAPYTWKWQKKNEDGGWTDLDRTGSGAQSVLPVTNVADSGTYRLFATLTDEQGTANLDTAISEEIAVDIAKKAIILVPEDIEKPYLTSVEELNDAILHDAVYAYDTYDAESRTGNGRTKLSEIPGDLVRDTITVKADFSTEGTLASGTYDLGVEGIPEDPANYTVTTQTGHLTILPIAYEDGLLSAAFADADPTYPYTSEIGTNGCTPEVIVKYKNGNTELVLVKDTDYTLQYSENDHAGSKNEASVKITFTGNYSGEKTLHFTITKADIPTDIKILMDGWTYGDNQNTPKLSTYVTGLEESAVEYSYTDADGNKLSANPVNAGTYRVSAHISETANYKAADLDGQNAVEFTISKRFLVVQANSATFEYDGNEHRDAGYTISRVDHDPNSDEKYSIIGGAEAAFPAGEGFKYVLATGMQKNNGWSDNKISYELNPSTSKGNYSIKAIDGKLEVTAQKLLPPANIEWDSAQPGKAKWLAVSKQDLLNPGYRAALYAVDENDEETVVRTEDNLQKTEFDFSSDIRTFASEHSDQSYSYIFKVQTLNGAGSEKNENYDVSEPGTSAALHTVRVSTDNSTVPSDQLYFKNDQNDQQDHTVILLEGEAVVVKYEVKEGYHVRADDWYISENAKDALTLDTNLLTTLGWWDVKLHAGRNLTSSVTDAKIGFTPRDNAPKVYNFTAENKQTAEDGYLKLCNASGNSDR